MAQLSERFCLNLTDTLTGNAKVLANLFQSTTAAVLQTKAQLQYPFFTDSKRFQNLLQLFTQQSKGSSVGRRRCIVVLNEIAQMRILFFADRSFQKQAPAQFS